MEENIIPCKDCFHFKTVVIQTNSMRYFYFSNYKHIVKHLTNCGELRIYYCKKEQLPHAVYINKNYCYALTSMTCKFRDGNNT